MIDHVTHLLGAYYDGELHGQRLGDVSEHLEVCASCRAELDQLETLSEVLAQHPDPVDLTPGERFVSQIALQMPRTPKGPVMRRAFNLGWQAAPVGILGVWAFVQSLLIVSGILFLLMRLGLNLDPMTDLMAQPASGLNLGMFLGFEEGSISELSRTAVEVLGNGGPLGWGSMLTVGLMLVLALLYCSWMATWWVRQREANGV
jgi:hypothetical protein